MAKVYLTTDLQYRGRSSEQSHKTARYNALSCTVELQLVEKHVVRIGDGLAVLSFLYFDQRIDVLVCTSGCWYTVSRCMFHVLQGNNNANPYTVYVDRGESPPPRHLVFDTRIRWIVLLFVFEPRSWILPFEVQAAPHSLQTVYLRIGYTLRVYDTWKYVWYIWYSWLYITSRSLRRCG